MLLLMSTASAAFDCVHVRPARTDRNWLLPPVAIASCLMTLLLVRYGSVRDNPIWSGHWAHLQTAMTSWRRGLCSIDAAAVEYSGAMADGYS